MSNDTPAYMKSFLPKWSEPAPARELDLGEVLLNLDDATLRKLLGIKEFTIGQEGLKPVEEANNT